MPPAQWDDAFDDLDDPEYPDYDVDNEDETETIACPNCSAEVYEDADQCPRCGEYLIADTRVWSGKPTWWIAMGILGIIAVAAALILGM